MRAKLQAATLSGATLQGTKFGSADLRGADLSCVQPEGCASLQGANLSYADLRGADLRGAHLWRALVDKGANLSERWGLVDLRGVDVDPIKDIDGLIEWATQQTTDESTRDRIAEELWAALQDDNIPDVPLLVPAPHVLIEAGDALPERLHWNMRGLEKFDAFDQKLTAFLGGLGCGKGATPQVAQGLARRALYTQDDQPDRLFPKLLATRLVGDNCPPAADISNYTRMVLQKLATR